MVISQRRILAARITALVADAIQIVFIPLFAEGAISPFVDVLDVAVALVMIALLGWHWVFVPAFIVELLPIADIAPTWTIAVYLATRTVTLEPPPQQERSTSSLPPATPSSHPAR